MVSELEIGRDATNRASADPTTALETGCGVAVSSAVGKLLPPVASRVEGERVKVDLTTGRVAEDEARGPPVVLCAPELWQEGDQTIEILAPYDEVQVVMRARLLAEERVDTPTSVDPPVDAYGIQAFEDLEDIVGLHGMPPVSRLGAYARAAAAQAPWHFLNFLPEPHQHGSLRPSFS